MAQSSQQLHMISQFLWLLSRMRANTIQILTIEERINIGLCLHLLSLYVVLKGADVST